MWQGILQLQDILYALSLLSDAFLAFVDSLKHFPKKQLVNPCILQTHVGQGFLARQLVVHLSSFPQLQFHILR